MVSTAEHFRKLRDGFKALDESRRKKEEDERRLKLEAYQRQLDKYNKELGQQLKQEVDKREKVRQEDAEWDHVNDKNIGRDDTQNSYMLLAWNRLGLAAKSASSVAGSCINRAAAAAENCVNVAAAVTNSIRSYC